MRIMIKTLLLIILSCVLLQCSGESQCIKACSFEIIQTSGNTQADVYGSISDLLRYTYLTPDSKYVIGGGQGRKSIVIIDLMKNTVVATITSRDEIVGFIAVNDDIYYKVIKKDGSAYLGKYNIQRNKHEYHCKTEIGEELVYNQNVFVICRQNDEYCNIRVYRHSDPRSPFTEFNVKLPPSQYTNIVSVDNDMIYIRCSDSTGKTHYRIFESKRTIYQSCLCAFDIMTGDKRWQTDKYYGIHSFDDSISAKDDRCIVDSYEMSPIVIDRKSGKNMSLNCDYQYLLDGFVCVEINELNKLGDEGKRAILDVEQVKKGCIIDLYTRKIVNTGDYKYLPLKGKHEKYICIGVSTGVYMLDTVARQIVCEINDKSVSDGFSSNVWCIYKMIYMHGFMFLLGNCGYCLFEEVWGEKH